MSDTENKVSVDVKKCKKTVDYFAKIYYSSDESNFAVKSDAINRVCEMLYKCRNYFFWVDKREDVKNAGIGELEFEDIYSATMFKCIQKYNIDESNGKGFFNFFSQRLHFAIVDEGRKNRKVVIDEETNEKKNVRTKFSLDEVKSELERPSEDFTNDFAEADAVNDMICKLLMHMIELFELLNERNKEARLLYFKSFYTSRMVDLIRKETSFESSVLKAILEHQQEVLESLEMPLLNYTYYEYPTDVEHIFSNCLKLYCELENLDSRSVKDKVIDTPFIKNVLRAYFVTQYNKDVSEANISKANKQFEDFLTGLKKSIY